MKEIIFASDNSGKLAELQSLLSPLQVIPQSVHSVTAVAETGLSFVENAIIKARHAAQCTGLPALADDSGLVVDALNGAPGIHSARYAGADASDQANLMKLLHALQHVAAPQRTASFHCCLALLRYPNDPSPHIYQGFWHGQILTTPQGEQGFGYDPIFYLPEHGCSAAQLSREQKNQESHRGQALQKLITDLLH